MPGLTNALRAASFGHPRVKWLLREGWAASRKRARRLGLRQLFEPSEIEDIRRVRSGGHTPGGGTPRVLFLSMRGWSTALLWETTIARALRVRGAEPVFATCGGRLPICDVANVHSSPPMPCLSCSDYALTALEAAGFDALTLRDLVDLPAETRAARERVAGFKTVADMEGFIDDGVPIGAFMRIPVLWFLARGTLPEEPRILDTYRRFLISGQVVRRAFSELLDRTDPESVFMINGNFFAERVMFAIAQSRNVRVVTYERGFLTDSLVVTLDSPACHYDIDPMFWEIASRTPLDVEQQKVLDDYLDARTRGERAPDNYWKELTEEVGIVRHELNLDGIRPMAALFCNIVWDTAVQEKDIGFKSMSDWTIRTIEGFAERPEVDLVVRVHPAEVRVENHRTTERMEDLIRKRFPILPANVRLVAAESGLSSYTLMNEATLGLVYTSTVGLELALRGVPAVVAADTHYRNRGFTTDAPNVDDYWRIIDDLVATQLPQAERDRRRELARRYAYLFFFRFTQNFGLVQEFGRALPRLTYDDEGALLPGRDQALDLIVAAIVEGLPVVTPVVMSAPPQDSTDLG